MMTHPIVDGLPILLGDWMRGEDENSSGPGGGNFTMTGRVRYIRSLDDDGTVVGLTSIEGFTEDFYAEQLTRVEAPDE